MDREKFWRGLGAKHKEQSHGPGYYRIGKFGVAGYSQTGAGWQWTDPTSAKEVPLEVLLDGLERLVEEETNHEGVITIQVKELMYKVRIGTFKDLDKFTSRRNKVFGWVGNRRTAIIQAILNLAGLED